MKYIIVYDILHVIRFELDFCNKIIIRLIDLGIEQLNSFIQNRRSHAWVTERLHNAKVSVKLGGEIVKECGTINVKVINTKLRDQDFTIECGAVVADTIVISTTDKVAKDSKPLLNIAEISICGKIVLFLHYSALHKVIRSITFSCIEILKRIELEQQKNSNKNHLKYFHICLKYFQLFNIYICCQVLRGQSSNVQMETRWLVFITTIISK